MTEREKKRRYTYDELKEKYIDQKVKTPSFLTKRSVQGFNLFIAFIFNMVFVTLLGIVIGYVLDRWLNTSPLFLIVMILLSIVAAFRNLISWYLKQEVNHNGKQGSERNHGDGDNEG